MPVFHNNVIAGAAGQGSASVSSYEISRSLAFNKSDTPNLTRTPSSDGDRKKWTWSGWVKRGELGGSYALFGAYQNSTRRDVLRFSSDALELQIGTSGGFVSETTSASFRDPGAWYHIVVTYDSTQATAANRVKFYVNGVEQAKTGTPVDQDTQSIINKANLQVVGARSTDGTASLPFDGCMAEVYFIDGQVLAPTVFGEVSPSTGAWNPTAFSGSYTTTVTSTSLSQTGWQTSQEANIWDGDTSTVAHGYANNMVGTVTFDPPLTNVTKVEVYQQNYVHYLNGSTVTTSETDTEWHVLYNNSSSPITLTTLGNSYTNNTQTVDIFAIRINDSVVDAQTWSPPSSSGIVVQGGGGNSYYLKFADNSSNSALGTDSSGQSNAFTVGNLQAASSSGSEVTAAWAGYTAAWATTDTWSSLTDQTTNFGNNGGTKGYSTSTETWSGDKSPTTGDFGASNRGGNGWALRYPSSTTITIDPGAQSYLSDLVVCPDESTSIANGTSVSTFPATVTGQVFWLRYTGAGYPAVDAFGTVTNPANSLSDSVIDTPTNYEADSGNNGGNYATWNPLDVKTTLTLSNGNLNLVGSSDGRTRATLAMPSGKWYWEITVGAVPASNHVGVWATNVELSTDTYRAIYRGDGYWIVGGSAAQEWSSVTTDDIVGITFDASTRETKFYKNNSLLGTKTAPELPAGSEYTPAVILSGSNSSLQANFGQRPFEYTPPSGFQALCTQNFPSPAFANSANVFDVTTYSGDGTNDRDITGFRFSPDLVWIKAQNQTDGHMLFDSVRGATKVLKSNNTNAELTESNSLTAFNSDGFTVGNNSSNAQVNASNFSYVGWVWDGGSSNTTISVGGLNSSLYDQSERWRDALTSSNGYTSGYEADKAFDGVFASGGGTANTGGGGSLTFQPANALTVTSLELECYSDVTLTLPDGTTQSIAGTGGVDRYRTADIGSGFSFTGSNSISLSRNGGYVYLGRIKINGKELIDDDVTVTNVPTIASTCRSNQAAGFSIISYQGNGTAGASIAHNLNSLPGFLIVKNRTTGVTSPAWGVKHSALYSSSGNWLELETTDAAVNESAGSGSLFDATNPTSSAITLGPRNTTNTNGDNYIAYCWTPISQLSAMGSYEGNGSADGAFIQTSFRPALVVCKNVDASQPWQVYDSARGTSNVIDEGLQWNSSNAEYTGTDRIDFLSNGFKIKASGGAEPNVSGETYIYFAVAETPVKFSRAR